jgi:hypothetical protein
MLTHRTLRIKQQIWETAEVGVQVTLIDKKSREQSRLVSISKGTLPSGL